ncbi:polyphosphate kinase 2 family protein [Subsaximicrobium wynnwilliamsii]|uniref:Polyphosphate kinase 2 family protein n=1 Tax=Subsaximicrobium wynnwilliamsii TaxID=291179 RepID=A0A5C6ZCN6_9FLAO|nr:PPK2 family polyphosphate kinase [Subsaximicrobium wynnwilliamsii]TXD82038.1 polyphosphate kinase 2 family protein [Subsaximicrobium wynnwilliamsii]TXD87240.1 polyphosphate kinase 2 family protein [Subsaximicrobium wynnwilliamsii]TXE01498.1 polyphosphate kinase 2 family protein [Subsaximicrobium wynnwilliamsii]
MKKIDIKDFKITEQFQLKNVSTSFDLDADKKKIEKELEEVREDLGDFQNKIYAHGKYAVLVCIQGMDTAGKDSLIREVFKDFNSRGVVVHSFKVPTDLEKKHDYLWRHYIALPARGKFGVFNRTHYENVLVTRVHPEFILGENLPDVNTLEDINEAFWEKRFEEINNFEKHIAENGTIIFKFFLHLSKDEQKNRLLRRLDKPEKNWKFSPSDLEERKLWDTYQACYEDAINKTSKFHAPWYIVPADDKPTARYIVARTLYDTLITYTDIKEPRLDPEIEANLDDYREQLNND